MQINVDRDEVFIPLEAFSAFSDSAQARTAEDEEKDEQCRESLVNMKLAMSRSKYDMAFAIAQDLRKQAYAKYYDEIESCFLSCAEHGAREALAFLTERMICRNDGRPSAEAFSYICRLADMGYIRSFVWLAECYDWGIGCSIDRGKAARYYVESILFTNNERAKKLYKRLKHEPVYPIADSVYWGLVDDILHGKMGRMARVRLAELILEGRIPEYAPASAFALLMLEYKGDYYYNNGLLLFHLAECYLYGIGVETDYAKAYALLESAEAEIEWDLDDEAWEDDEEPLFEEKDYAMALEKVRLLLKETEEKVDCDCLDDPLLDEELENEKPQWMKRRS